MTNGYIQIDCLGKKRGLKFGMLAVQQITLESQKLGLQLGQNVDVALIPVIVYWGLFNNCYVKREDPDFTFENVCDWVDENVTNTEVFQKIAETFYNSRVIKGAAEQDADKDEKKSSILPTAADGTSSAPTSPEK
jgi:hypothetical protein